jgi:hypothetical protein
LSNEDLTFSLTIPDLFRCCQPSRSQDVSNRTVLPIPEPQPPVITELDARNVKAGEGTLETVEGPFWRYLSESHFSRLCTRVH